MEPEPDRLDREQSLADHIAAAARIQREVDAVAAAEKRRVFLEWFVNRMRIEAKGEPERRHGCDRPSAFTTS